jgi:hypothetical protein
MTTYGYETFGLTISSEYLLPISSPSSSRETADITIRRAESLPDSWSGERAGEGDYFFGDGMHRFGWPELGIIEIRDAREVTVHPLASVAAGLVEHVLLGPVLADILLSRGQLPLHASAVQTPSGVIALVGRSGQGKSTLAAALNVLGAPLHGDDLIAISPRDAEVPRGLGRVKLNPDVLSALGASAAELPVVYEGIEKRAMPGLGVATPISKPLLAVYRIRDGVEIRVAKVDPRRALFDVFANCFRVEVAQHACGAQELLRRCSLVLERAEFFDFFRPRDLQGLPRATEALWGHACSLGATVR